MTWPSGWTVLPLPAGFDQGQALAISTDGGTIVGTATAGSGGSANTIAVLWTQGASPINLGNLYGGGLDTEAYDVSADGSVVVGYSTADANGDTHAFRWTAAGGMVDLGTFSGETTLSSFAFSVSADGNTIGGGGDIAGSHAAHVFRWTAASGIVDLGVAPPPSGMTFLANEAAIVSPDGTVITGLASYALIAGGTGYTGPYVWTAATGMTLTSNLANGAVQRPGNDGTVIAVGGSPPFEQVFAPTPSTTTLPIPTGYTSANAQAVTMPGAAYIAGTATNGTTTVGVAWHAGTATVIAAPTGYTVPTVSSRGITLTGPSMVGSVTDGSGNQIPAVYVLASAPPPIPSCAAAWTLETIPNYP
jgi:probable HAF family extracellular repeat protein